MVSRFLVASDQQKKLGRITTSEAPPQIYCIKTLEIGSAIYILTGTFDHSVLYSML